MPGINQDIFHIRGNIIVPISISLCARGQDIDRDEKFPNEALLEFWLIL